MKSAMAVIPVARITFAISASRSAAAGLATAAASSAATSSKSSVGSTALPTKKNTFATVLRLTSRTMSTKALAPSMRYSSIGSSWPKARTLTLLRSTCISTRCLCHRSSIALSTHTRSTASRSVRSYRWFSRANLSR